MTGAEARHLAMVCRHRPGDQVCLFNGDGHEYPARIASISKKAVLLEVLAMESPARELKFALEIAAPIPKGDRAQFLVEKLTELGVTAYVPLLCQYSAGEPRDNKLDKLKRYVIEASKQCGRNALMTVDEPTDWAVYCQRKVPGELRIIADQQAAQPWPEESKLHHGSIRCAVGPEGGWTEEEVAAAAAHAWRPVTLGARTLRLETAALALAVRAISASGF